jgi:hypothetical protein
MVLVPSHPCNKGDRVNTASIQRLRFACSCEARTYDELSCHEIGDQTRWEIVAGLCSFNLATKLEHRISEVVALLDFRDEIPPLSPD